MRAPTGGEWLAPSIAALSVAFLAVAAAGAGAAIGGSPGVPSAPAGVLIVGEWLGGFLLLGLAATTAAALLLMRPPHRRRPEDYEEYVEPRKLSLVARLVLTVLAALVIAACLTALRAARSSTPPATSRSGLLRHFAHPSAPVARVASNNVSHLPPFAWSWFALAASVVLFLAGAALVGSNMRRMRTLPSSSRRRGRDRRVDDDALAYAAAHAEPRLAVRLSYAWMRRTLAARGIDSEDSEAPGEYARRVSSLLPDLVGPMVQLTYLYERARFSSLEIDEDAKRAALADLRALRPEAPQ